jgi:hypothetical protein
MLFVDLVMTSALPGNLPSAFLLPSAIPMHTLGQRSTLAFILAVALLAPLTEALSSGWFIAGQGQSCDDACSPSLGRTPCHLPSLQAINEPYFLERVKLELGANAFPCLWNGTQSVANHGPSMDASSTMCFTAPPSTASCAARAVPPSVSRLCCCSSTGCSATMDSILREWRKFVPKAPRPAIYLPLDG